MIETGNAIRQRHGPGGLATRLTPKLLPDRNYVIDSIRHPAEVEVLRERASALPALVWIEADEGLRLERMRSRGRGGDPQTLEALRDLEERELASDDPSAQQLLAVQQLADATLRNDGAVEALHAQVQTLLRALLFFERPSWDEYFMSIARVVASRSNCVKRKVAAVITRDRRIVSTGYNGTPRGTPNCNEGGCPRCNAFAEGGTRLDECLCSHGEENAITQAAYHGVMVKGGTLYIDVQPVPDVHEDDHQCRAPGGGLQRGLPARARWRWTSCARPASRCAGSSCTSTGWRDSPALRKRPQAARSEAKPSEVPNGMAASPAPGRAPCRASARRRSCRATRARLPRRRASRSPRPAPRAARRATAARTAPAGPSR